VTHRSKIIYFGDGPTGIFGVYYSVIFSLKSEYDSLYIN